MADSEVANNQGVKIRHDWYQTDTHVIISILHKNIKEADLKVDFKDKSLNVSFPLESGEQYNLNLGLAYEIVPAESSFKIFTSKVEVKLKKQAGYRWTNLEGDTCSREMMKSFPSGESSAAGNKNSSRKEKNWDEVVSDIINSDEFKPEGEEALQALFQKIYSDGSDEVKKAMNKSFFESGGTVLSTSWEEVKNAPVDVKPPDGVEWKKWDS